MPQRTNEFQELVSLIEKTLAPDGAVVTDSAMVVPQGMRKPTEVDILIDTPLGPYRVKVAVEVADDGRKFGMEDFNSYIAKYRGECRVLVDKFVIITRAGFTKNVIEKAEKIEVELLTLAEAKEKDWSQVKPQFLTVNAPPFICGIRFEPNIEVQEPRDIWKVGRMICPHGHDHGSPMERANSLLRKLLVTRAGFFRDLHLQARDNPEKIAHAHSQYSFPNWTVRYANRDYPITRFMLDIHITTGTSLVSCTQYERTSSSGRLEKLQHLKATVGGMSYSWVRTEESNQKRIMMSIRSTNTEAKQPIRETQSQKEKIKRRKAAKDKQQQKRSQRGK